MSLLTTLPGALAGALNFALTEFGVACYVRRKVESSVSESDGSTSLEAAIVGTDATVQVVLDRPLSVAMRNRWGSDTLATTRGIAKLDAGLLMGDFLIPDSGDFNGLWFEVVERMPTEAGNVVELGMRQVPAQEAGDPVVG